MLKKDVVAHFGTQEAVAQALGITRQAVQQWPDVVPRGRAYELQFLTKGKLVAAATKRQKKLSKGPPASQPIPL